MDDVSLHQAPTIRDRFVAALTRDDETAAQRLAPLLDGPESLDQQRTEAWALLTASAHWVASALDAAGIPDSDETPITDSETAFQRAQHLDAQLWKLNQKPGRHDAIAFLVEAAKRAYYRGADLGPVPGGRLASFRAPGAEPNIPHTVEADPEDLRAIGSELGETLRRYGALGLGQSTGEALAAFDATELAADY
jgi:hypothetical protein